MTFRPQAVVSFVDIFDEVAPRIREFEGCRHLELWQHEEQPEVLTTYSLWDNEASLDRYKESDLFQSTWTDVKPLFGARPQVTSYRLVRSVTDAPPPE